MAAVNKGRVQSNAYTAYLNQRRGQTNGANTNAATTNRPGVAPEARVPAIPLVQGQKRSLGGRPSEEASPRSTGIVLTDILTVGQVSPGQTVQFTVGAVSPDGAVRLTDPVVLGGSPSPQGA